MRIKDKSSFFVKASNNNSQDFVVVLCRYLRASAEIGG
jgi:hypothetical protein